MSEITLQEAKAYARQMANFFKVFKYVEEVVDLAVASSELVEANQKELDRIKEEIRSVSESKTKTIRDLEEQISEAEAKLRHKLEEVGDQIAKANELAEKRIREIDARVREKEDYYKTMELKMMLQIKDLEKSFADKEAAYFSEIAKLEEERKAAEEKLAKANEKLLLLKKMLGE